ncbi:rab3 GTPase-activating protein non-catalytic subunit-like isoform X2 [Halichondria panicea]
MSTKPRPQATAVLVLPIAFSIKSGTVQRSSVVLVGFSDGYIRSYSMSGQRVMSQLLHPEAVKRLSCMATIPTQRSSPSQCNVVVSYPEHVCVVDGGSLVNVIKTYVENKSTEAEGEEVSVSHKKWRLRDQTSTIDVVLLGHSTPTAFDHLCEASSVGGFETTLRSTPTPEAHLITVGESPMIALYKITKDAGHLNMSEVVHAVASKVSNAVLGKISQASGWLRWSKSSNPAPKPPAKKEKVQLSTNLPMTTNVPDSRRSVLSITVSPQGNLAALVDCFGRVLLLECEGLVVRRMWKGYRDAQCGWLLVHDTPSTGRGKRKRTPTVSPHTKKAQCLCIYAPRRGIVELWPVQSGSRVAVFQVGKDCQLLYSPHGTFTFNLDEEGGAVSKERKAIHNERGIRETVLLLCPDGQLVTFGVPFPLLTRLGDPTSFDAHLMKKLPQAIQAGDSDLLVQVFSGLKSSQSMKQAVDILIGAQHTQYISYDVIVKMLQVALERIDRADLAVYPLFRYVTGVRQATELLQGVEELASTQDTPSTSKLDESLRTLCDIPLDRAGTISSCLQNYFSGLSQRKTVIKSVDLKAFVKCFELPSKVGNVLLGSSNPMGSEEGGRVTRSLSRTYSSQPLRLSLKEGLATSTLLDIGSTLFLKLLTTDVADYSLSTLYQSCGVVPRDLLSLLCLVCVNGVASERSPTELLKRQHKLLTLICALPSSEISPNSSVIKGEEPRPDLWWAVLQLCSESSQVGHALLVALVCQKFVSASTNEDMESGNQDWESWEPVSSEKERWITLTHQLEVLTFVSNLIGRDSLAHLPPAPYAFSNDDDKRVIELSNLLPFNSEEGAMCAGSLGKYGPGLIAHCLAKWLVTNHIPAEFVAIIPSDPHDNNDPKYSRLVFQLSPLLKLLPCTLSHPALLIHCAWQGVHCSMQGVIVEPAVTLEYLSLISTRSALAGLVGVLWHCVYENQVNRIIENLKRGGVVDDQSKATLSVCRNIFSWLYKVNCHGGELGTEEESESVQGDLIPLATPPGMSDLMDVVQRFPPLPPTVTKTYLELLLLAELSAASPHTLTLTTFFPTWLRGALKKGAYKSAWQEQIPVQLKQKRTKCLCEAVVVYLSPTSPPPVPPTLASHALSQLPPTGSALSLEVASHRDIVFLLVDLWQLDSDAVRKQWVTGFFAAGLAENGSEVFMGIEDKSRVSQELVPFSGQLCDHLLQRVNSKSRQLALMAQVSPSLLEYLRNQGKRPLPSVCTKVEPSWTCVSKLLSLLQPYVAAKTSVASILTALAQLVKKCSVDS